MRRFNRRVIQAKNGSYGLLIIPLNDHLCEDSVGFAKQQMAANSACHKGFRIRLFLNE